MLSRVLATGNVLNADTHRGGALAIKLDSLQKMSDVKARMMLLACSRCNQMACGLGICRQSVKVTPGSDLRAACRPGECDCCEH